MLRLINRGRSGFTDSLNGRGREGSGYRETDSETGPNEASKSAEERRPFRPAVVQTGLVNQVLTAYENPTKSKEIS